jgi:ElaB/YqjD/DUF883 family membrane-anchored ribosome-binding protein
MADDAGEQSQTPQAAGRSQSGTAAVDRLKSDLSSLRSDLEAAARTVNQLGNSAAQEAMSQAQAQMEDVRARIEEFLGRAEDYGDRSVEAIREHVQERPFQSLLIAMATGFALAHLFGRR